MMTDPIADMLTRIRNAQAARKGSVEVSLSKIKKQIAEILFREGYLGKITEDKTALPKLILELKYNGKQALIQSLDRISKPGHRVYAGADNLPTVINDYGIAIISTSKGLMTNKEAKKAKMGGEIICTVY
jgi:small subunit ribosomal protein S8